MYCPTHEVRTGPKVVRLQKTISPSIVLGWRQKDYLWKALEKSFLLNRDYVPEF